MIKVEFFVDKKKKSAELSVTGHAEMAEEGKDLVCAASSILAYTAEAAVSELKGKLSEEPKVKMQTGIAVISCVARSKRAYREIVRSLLIIMNGYKILAESFPEYIKYSSNVWLGEKP